MELIKKYQRGKRNHQIVNAAAVSSPHITKLHTGMTLVSGSGSKTAAQ